MSKKYFWLKLKDDFFKQKEIKMLRRVAGGDTYTIIYLKMLLLSLKNDGKIFYDEIAEDMISEISLEIDEEEDNVKIAFNYLLQKRLIESDSDDSIEMLQIGNMIGGETDSAIRVRKHRDKALHCNTDVTKSNTEIEIEKEIKKELEIKKPVKDDGAIDRIWNAYPIKKGKALAIKKIPKLITEHGEDKIIRAVQRYADEVKGTDPQFIKHGSTFFSGGILDYLADDFTPTVKKKDVNVTSFNDYDQRTSAYSEKDFLGWD